MVLANLGKSGVNATLNPPCFSNCLPTGGSTPCAWRCYVGTRPTWSATATGAFKDVNCLQPSNPPYDFQGYYYWHGEIANCASAPTGWKWKWNIQPDSIEWYGPWVGSQKKTSSTPVWQPWELQGCGGTNPASNPLLNPTFTISTDNGPTLSGFYKKPIGGASLIPITLAMDVYVVEE
jgi:hypothetical protein